LAHVHLRSIILYFELQVLSLLQGLVCCLPLSFEIGNPSIQDYRAELIVGSWMAK
jgi:hypothetical protein